MSGPTVVSRTIAAPPDAIWSAITDVTRMGEWSPECHTCEWDAGVSGASVGATFTGHNRHGEVEWSNQATITDCVPAEKFAFEVGFTGPVAEMFGDAPFSRWEYEIEPTDGGSVVTETSHDWRSAELEAASLQLMPDITDRAAHNRGTMTATLDKLAAAVE
jgi:uncharacterized protein YndB with AHSA1/START domain